MADMLKNLDSISNGQPESENIDPVESNILANLVSLQNRVKIKPHNDIAWSYAAEGQNLFHQDALQTLKESRATIEFSDNSYLDLKPESLIIVQGIQHRYISNRKKELSIKIDGAFSGRIVRQSSDEHLKVSLPDFILEAHSRNNDKLDFDLEVNEDKSSTIAIHEGVAKIQAGDQTVYVSKNHLLSIASDSLETKSITKSKFVRLLAPEMDAKILYRELTPPVLLRWSGLDTKSNQVYMVRIAKDRNFTNLILEKSTRKNEIVVNDLADGKYFWSVSYDTENFVRPRNIGRFSVYLDNIPPKLSLSSLPSVVYQDFLILSGRSEPGCRLLINNEPVTIRKDGAFKKKLKLRMGAQIIVFESIDKAGNASYGRHTVIRKTKN
jgi:hypothetical protein